MKISTRSVKTSTRKVKTFTRKVKTSTRSVKTSARNVKTSARNVKDSVQDPGTPNPNCEKRQHFRPKCQISGSAHPARAGDT